MTSDIMIKLNRIPHRDPIQLHQQHGPMKSDFDQQKPQLKMVREKPLAKVLLMSYSIIYSCNARIFLFVNVLISNHLKRLDFSFQGHEKRFNKGH